MTLFTKHCDMVPSIEINTRLFRWSNKLRKVETRLSQTFLSYLFVLLYTI